MSRGCRPQRQLAQESVRRCGCSQASADGRRQGAGRRRAAPADRRLPRFPIVSDGRHSGVDRLPTRRAIGASLGRLDSTAKTLRIERAIEETREFGRILKEPKSRRGRRTIAIDNGLLALLLGVRERFLRLQAGVPDGAAVNPSMIKLPIDALMFPAPPRGGTGFDMTKLRCPRALTHETRKRFRRLGFDLRFHDLRVSHGTALLDAGVPVHVVAARLGHDPAVLMRAYAKRTQTADTSAAAVIGTLSRGIL